MAIKNGNNGIPPQLDNGEVKVVVVGEPNCGKTRLIRGYYDRHYPGIRYVHYTVWVYPCQFQGNAHLRRVSIFEIPGHPAFFAKQRVSHYEEADIIVFVYAIDDPSSFQMLSDRWISETYDIIESKSIPVVFVGTKKDLRDNQHVIQRLAVQNQSPVTYHQGLDMIHTVPYDTNVAFRECSVYDLQDVDEIFNHMFTMVQAIEKKEYLEKELITKVFIKL